MVNKLLLNGFLSLLVFACANQAHAQNGADKVIGTWMSTDKNLVVQVYREGDDFKSKLIWFDDSDDLSKPMDTRVDDKNPDKSLRARKIVGMQVLRSLSYSAGSNTWENGMIYDAKNGREWNAAAKIDRQGLLEVTGYWHFKFIGKTMKFSRMTPSDMVLVSR